MPPAPRQAFAFAQGGADTAIPPPTTTKMDASSSTKNSSSTEAKVRTTMATKAAAVAGGAAKRRAVAAADGGKLGGEKKALSSSSGRWPIMKSKTFTPNIYGLVPKQPRSAAESIAETLIPVERQATTFAATETSSPTSTVIAIPAPTNSVNTTGYPRDNGVWQNGWTEWTVFGLTIGMIFVVIILTHIGIRLHKNPPLWYQRLSLGHRLRNQNLENGIGLRRVGQANTVYGNWNPPAITRHPWDQRRNWSSHTLLAEPAPTLQVRTEAQEPRSSPPPPLQTTQSAPSTPIPPTSVLTPASPASQSSAISPISLTGQTGQTRRRNNRSLEIDTSASYSGLGIALQGERVSAQDEGRHLLLRSPDLEDGLLSPEARRRFSPGSPSDWPPKKVTIFTKFGKGVEMAADKLARVLHQQVHGNPEDGLLLPVRDSEREGLRGTSVY